MEQNKNLRQLNTFGMNAHARWFAAFDNVETLRELLADNRDKKLLILGGGSNILFTEDFGGLVLKNEIHGVHAVNGEADTVLVTAGAGENWHRFVLYTLEQGWYGLENLSLIPGNVGASPMQNIGAYGVEIKDVFHSLRAMHIETGRVDIFDREACAFGYRESVFKHALKGQYIILDVTYALHKIPEIRTAYGVINEQLEAMGISNPGPKDVSAAVIAIRQSKLPDPAELGNAGSFFKNPVIRREHFERLLPGFPGMPSYPAGDSHVKVPAGWLIEQAGWKGKRSGACGVHERQALVLVNYGDADGKSIFQLSQDILDDIYARFGIVLEREVNIL